MLVYVATYPRSGSGVLRSALLRNFGYMTANGYAAVNAVQPDADPDLVGFGGHRMVAEPALQRLDPETRKRLAALPEPLFVKTHERPYDEWFPGEVAIQMVRHPGATMTSFYNLKRQASPDVRLEKFLRRTDWADYHRAWLAAGLPVLRLRYEEMYDDPVLVDHLAAFLKLDPIASRLESSKDAHLRNPERNPGWGVDGWRVQLTPAIEERLWEINGEVAARLGYSRTGEFDCAPPAPSRSAAAKTSGARKASPYSDRPDWAFWNRSVAGRDAFGVDPVIEAPFRIGKDDAIATAGSCFAQHIARTLQREGYHYLVTEPAPAGHPAPESFGVFPARFGNIYTVRQLLQTFDRAYGLFDPADRAWVREDGALVDPFRPQIQPQGFATAAALEEDRLRHFECVRTMFEDCDVFVFTLGLTEGWRSTRDGAVFPLAPGVAGGEPGPGYEFHNFSAAEMTADLKAFLRKLRTVNPGVRVILTVSPVPLIATYEPRHVLVATTYSKAALRVTAEEVATSEPDVCYFPSYEIIMGPQTGARFFAADLRSVTDEGVTRVMGVFADHFFGTSDRARAKAPQAQLSRSDIDRLTQLSEVICDEEAIDP
jgi:hypothetical protein